MPQFLRRKFIYPLTGFLLLIGVFLFSHNARSAWDANVYNKAYNGTLTATEWNHLFLDFANTWLPVTMKGPVTIGTSTPSSLTVNGTITATTFSGSYTGTLGAQNVSSGAFGSNTGGGNYSFPGNVGIGTTAPASKLDVNGDIRITSGQLWMTSGFTFANVYPSRIYVYNTGTDGYRFQTGNSASSPTTRFSVGQGADIVNSYFLNTNVGIGTSAPNAQLTIRANGSAPQIHLGDTQDGGGMYIGAINEWAGVVPTDEGVISVGANFAFSGGAITSWTADTTNAQIIRSEGGAFFFYGDTGLTAGNTFTPTARMVLNSSGNLGIGNINPTSKLTLAGGDFAIDHNKSVIVNSAGVNTTLLLGNYSDGSGFAYGTSSSPLRNSASLAVEGDVKADRLCIEEDCKAAWSEIVFAGGGGQWVSSGNNIYNANSGNVGVGATSPQAKLDVRNPVSSSTPALSLLGAGAYGSGYQVSWGNYGKMSQSSSGANFLSWGAYNNGSTWTRTYDGMGIVNLVIGTGPYFSVQTDVATTGTPTFVDRLTVGSSGNVGIGTIVPGEKLSVVGDDSGTAISSDGVTINIGNSNTTANNIASISFGNGAAGNSWSRIGAIYTDRTGSSEDQDLFFGTIAAGSFGERMRIKSTGNVGIGTTNPLEKLHLGSGNIKLESNSSIIAETNSIEMYDGATGSLEITAQTNGPAARGINLISGTVTALRIDKTGNVGVGTTNPTTKLYVNGGTGDSINAGGGQVAGLNSTPLNSDHAVPLGYLQSNYAPIGTGAGSAFVQGGNSFGVAGVLGTNDNNLLNIETNNTVRMTVAANGSVGIGTSTPTDKLVINRGSVSNSSGGIVINNDTTNGYGGSLNINGNVAGVNYTLGRLLAENDGSGSYLTLSTAASGYGLNERMRITATGNVGIGTTTPQQKLDVNGNLVIRPTGTTDAISFLSLGSSQSRLVTTNNFAIHTGGGEAIRFLSGGNVGIGTTGPDSKLHIIGGAYNSGIKIESTSIDGSGITLKNTSSGGTSYNVFSTGSNNSPGAGAFAIYDTDYRLVIKGGNLGVGTTNPTTKLYVNGGTGNAINAGGGHVAGLNSTPVNSDHAVPLGYLQSNYAPIGTGAGSAFVQGGNSFGAAGVLGTNDNNLLNIETNNTVRMTVAANGNVGVGVTNPSRFFQVNGEALFSGAISHSLNTYTKWETLTMTNDSVRYIEFNQDVPAVGSLQGRSGQVKITFYNINGGESQGGELEKIYQLYWYNGAWATNQSQITNSFGTLSSLIRLGEAEVNGTKMRIPVYGGNGFGSGRSYAVKMEMIASNGTVIDFFKDYSITASSAAVFPGASYNQVSSRLGINLGSNVMPTAPLQVTGNALFSGNVGIGTTNPLTKIHSYLGGSGATPYQVANTALTLEGSARTTLQFLTPNNQEAYIIFGDPQSANAGWLSYTHSNDLMRLRSTGSIDFYTSDVRMTIQQNGNVGIGRTNPAAKLHFASSTIDQIHVAGGYVAGLDLTPTRSDHAVPLGYLQSNYAPIGSGAGSAFVQGGNSFGAAGVLGTNDNNLLNIETNNTVRMTVAANGNVGIGTTAPTKKFDVSVTGNDGIRTYRSDNTGEGHLFLGTSGMKLTGNSTYGFQFSNPSSVEVVRITPTGNVGIGTTNPMAKLNVVGGDAMFGSAMGVAISGENGRTSSPDGTSLSYILQTYATTGAYPYNEAGNLVLQSRNNRDISFMTGVSSPSVSMVVNRNGNVGIGRTNPAAKLHFASSTIDQIHVAGGYVAGLDLTPTRSDHAVPLGYLQANYSPNSGSLWGGTQNGNIWNGTNGSGNVGIGLTNPQAKLHVSGGVIMKRTAVADTDYTVLGTDYIIGYTSITANRTVTLPNALCTPGRFFVVVDESGNSSATSKIIIDPEGTTPIIGLQTLPLEDSFNSVYVFCGNNAWYIL